MGRYLRRDLDGGASISIWEITESEEELQKLISLSKEESVKLSQIRSAVRRREILAVNALLNSIFDEEINLAHHNDGSPFLQNVSIKVSISHTNRFVSILTHPNLDVGIDIESLDRNFGAVEKKALSKDEIDSLNTNERGKHLAIFWSVKEAIYKRLALPNIDFAKQIHIKPFTLENEGELTAVFTKNNGETREFALQYVIFENHVMAWIIG